MAHAISLPAYVAVARGLSVSLSVCGPPLLRLRLATTSTRLFIAGSNISPQPPPATLHCRSRAEHSIKHSTQPTSFLPCRSHLQPLPPCCARTGIPSTLLTAISPRDTQGPLANSTWPHFHMNHACCTTSPHPRRTMRTTPLVRTLFP